MALIEREIGQIVDLGLDAYWICLVCLNWMRNRSEVVEVPMTARRKTKEPQKRKRSPRMEERDSQASERRLKESSQTCRGRLDMENRWLHRSTSGKWTTTITLLFDHQGEVVFRLVYHKCQLRPPEGPRLLARPLSGLFTPGRLKQISLKWYEIILH